MFFFLFFLFSLFCTVASEISEHAFSSAKEDTVLACLDSNWTAIQYMENRKLHEQYNVMFFFYSICSNFFGWFQLVGILTPKCCLDLTMPPAYSHQLISGKEMIQETWVNSTFKEKRGKESFSTYSI